MKAKLTVFFIIVLMSGLFSCFYMLFKADLSLQPVIKGTFTGENETCPVYLISYAEGDDVFYKNQHTLAYSAQNKGIDVVMNYRKRLLDIDFQEKHKELLQIKQGAGLWSWKPQILLQTLKQAPENAIIIYSDVGFIFVRPIHDLLLQLQDNDVLLVKYPENQLIDSLPSKISMEWGIKDTSHRCFAGGFIVARNTARAQFFLQKWLELVLRQDYVNLCIQGADNKNPFTYDETLLGIMVAQYPEKVTHITYEQFRRWTIWHHRHPGNNMPLLFFQVLPLKQIREWLSSVFA